MNCTWSIIFRAIVVSYDEAHSSQKAKDNSTAVYCFEPDFEEEPGEHKNRHKRKTVQHLLELLISIILELQFYVIYLSIWY